MNNCTIENTASLDINIDSYNNICLVLDGVRYQVDKSKLKELCKPMLPTSFDEVESKYIQDRDLVDIHHEYSNELEILSKLLYLRDIYRQGWTPDWRVGTDFINYVIANQNEELIRAGNSQSNRIFAFQSSEIRDKFYINFKDMLEKVKDLI